MYHFYYKIKGSINEQNETKKRKVLAIALPIELYEKLDQLAKHTGRSKNFYVREALNRHLEDLEDIYLLEEV